MRFFPLILIVSALFFGCDSGSGNNPSDTSDGYYISAEVTPGFSSGWSADVEIIDNVTLYSNGSTMGDWISDATVTLNGTAVPVDVTNSYSENFDSLTAGQNMILSIDRQPISLSETLTLPSEPQITAPAGGSLAYDFTGNDDITLSWSALATNPDYIEIYIGALDTVSNEDYLVKLSGDALTHTIPAGTIEEPFMLPVEVQIRTVNETDLTGSDIHSQSSYRVMHYASVLVRSL